MKTAAAVALTTRQRSRIQRKAASDAGDEEPRQQERDAEPERVGEQQRGARGPASRSARR